MTAQTLTIYELLKKVLNEKDARVFIEYLEDSNKKRISESMAAKLTDISTKGDILLLKNDFLTMQESILKMESRLEGKISETKADLIKWLFLFIIGHMAAICSIIKWML